MKPANFPSRVLLRQARAAARALGQPEPRPPPAVKDIRFRVGAAERRRASYESTRAVPAWEREDHARVIAQLHAQEVQRERFNASAESAYIVYDTETHSIKPGISNCHACTYGEHCLHTAMIDPRVTNPHAGLYAQNGEPIKP